MKKKVLIIRSASLQQLDQNMPAIKEFFKDSQLDILTHHHFVEQCKKYNDISNVLNYGESGDFSFNSVPPEIKRAKYDAVVVLTTNISGAGFLNVQMMALNIKSKKIYLCNLVSDIKELPKSKIILLAVRNGLFMSLATLGALPLIALSPFLLLIGFASAKIKMKD
ncbi:MAG: hypothetical protein GY757_57450 [bacterium]|nr:hypothetical protein [bacterium]